MGYGKAVDHGRVLLEVARYWKAGMESFIVTCEVQASGYGTFRQLVVRGRQGTMDKSALHCEVYVR